MANRIKSSSNPFAEVAAISRGLKNGLTLDESKAKAGDIVLRLQRSSEIALARRNAKNELVAELRQAAKDKKQLMIIERAKSLSEQCIDIQKDPQVFFDLPVAVIKKEHVEAVLSQFGKHISTLAGSVDHKQRIEASRLWSGAFVSNVLKRAPSQFHTEKMLVQLITGQAEPNKFYKPTQLNMPAPQHLLKIFKTHPLMTAELTMTLVKINPWVIFGIPVDDRSSALVEQASNKFFSMGLLDGENSVYTKLERQIQTLDGYIDHVCKVRDGKSLPRISDFEKVVKAITRTPQGISFKYSTVQNAICEALIKSERHISHYSETAKSNAVFDLMHNDENRVFSIVRNQDGKMHMLDCIATLTAGEPSLSISMPTKNESHAHIGLGYIKHDQLIVCLKNGDKFSFHVDPTDHCFHELVRTNLQNAGASASPNQEVDEDFNEDDLKRLRQIDLVEGRRERQTG